MRSLKMSRTYFQYRVAGLDVSLRDNRVCYMLILEYVLSNVGVEFETGDCFDFVYGVSAPACLTR
jgi:hypothetical protein